MNPEVKAKWLAKLRDPKTPQTQHCLKNEDGFCCLGVLSDIYREEQGGTISWEDAGGSFTLLGNDALLPLAVQIWSGLERDFGGAITLSEKDTETYGRKGSKSILPEMNDHGMSFEQIADYIEEQL